MKHLQRYIKLICEQEQLPLPFPEEQESEEERSKREAEESKMLEKENLVKAFMETPSHGIHLAQMLKHEIAEDFHEIKENVLFLIELVEDKSHLMPHGGYNYPAQDGINRTGQHIIDDLIHVGIGDENEIFQLVKSVYMGCTNNAKSPYCIENTEALKEWVNL